MTAFNLALALIGVVVLVLGLVSDWLKQHGISDVLLTLVLGVAVGPVGLGLLDPLSWDHGPEIFEEAARLTIGIGLMGAALRLPGGYFPATWRSQAVLLIGAMAGMCAVSGLLVWSILGVPLAVAFLIGAIVTPTDPVVASSIVTGTVAEKNLPGRIPCLMTAEAGVNDGLALPLVLLGVALVGGPGLEDGVLAFVGKAVLWEIGGGVALGIALGSGTAYLLKLAERHRVIERSAYFAIVTALALLALGFGRLLHADGLLAIFAAGIAFDHGVPMEEREDAEEIAAAVDRFFSLPMFALIGMVLPWAAWAELGWRGPALAVAVLSLRRLPVVVAVHRWVKPLKSLGDAVFVGWFGPIGIAAAFYAALALRKTGLDGVFEVSLLLVVASVVVQGLTATPLTRLYGRTCDSISDDDDPGMTLAQHGNRALGGE